MALPQSPCRRTKITSGGNMMKVTSIALGATFASLLSGTAMAEQITVFDWSGYDDPGFFGAYVEKYGEAPNFSFFADDHEGFNKLRSGFKADLAHPCTSVIGKMRATDMLSPIDVSRLEAWGDLLPTLANLPFVSADGQVWMLPFDWGNTGLVYRTDLVTGDINLQTLADPAMAGKISLPDAVEDAYALAALAVGVTDWSQMTDEKFQEASDFLRAVHTNVRFYWSDQGQLDAAIKSGEIHAAWAWNATELAMIFDEIPAKMIRDPEVGVASWACGYVHLNNGEGGDEEVYDFLNALSSAESGKYLIESWGYAHANAKSYEIADQDAVAAYGYSDPEGFMASSLFGFNPSQEIAAKMLKEFERIKAGF
ncbi:extracellular solute-binding protein [Ruegeria arenilitoris]|uniref:extracellular solute-binding protein n=1 Tax=Ruegeria arenilitoris TaxID=1173585 RepID=UPI0034645327